jgi:hypothetical protein
MTKKADLMVEALRDSKPVLRAIASRPEKPKKHRYERRKARESLRLVDWGDDPQNA